MNVNRFFSVGAVAALAVLCAGRAAGATNALVTVSADFRTVTTDYYASLLTLGASTVKTSAAYPSGLAEPIFWFDASNTNGWEIAADGAISKIPSKTGARYLRVTKDEGNWQNGTWGWNLAKPVWTNGAGRLAGRMCVDFGAMGSDRGLIFNAIADADTGGVASNVLHHIGTIVAVIDASQGGGYLLGGGFGWNEKPNKNWWNDGCHWLRASPPDFTETVADYTPWTALTRGSGHVDFETGTMRRSGATLDPEDVGFSTEWETFTYLCASNRCQATGVGFGDARHLTSNGRSITGGQRIAELLIFDRVLSEADCAALENWLEGRWFDEARPGHDGAADLGAFYSYRSDWKGMGFPVTVDVPAGETLSIARNQHGRGGRFNATYADIANESAFVKTGAGTFALKDGVNFQGSIRLQQGCLTVPQRAVPTALPTNAFLHFDASCAETLATTTEGDVEYVDVWRSDGVGRLKGQPVVARALGANRPVLLRNALGAGKHALDFGARVSAMADGRYLTLTTNETTEAIVAKDVPQCMTYVAVFSAARGGGFLLGHNSDFYLRRGDLFPSSFRGASYAHVSDSTRAYADAIPVDKAEGGFQNAGWQTFALRGSGANDKMYARFLGSQSGHAGGLVLAEVAVYTRLLTDEEMCDAEAHLMRKWLGRTAPGYAFPSDFGPAQIQNLIVEGDDCEVFVAAGETLKIGKLSGRHALRKTGAGTLCVVENALTAGVNIRVEGGAAGPADPPDVAAKDALAAAPSVHLDATDADSLTFAEGTYEKPRVICWEDQGHMNAAYRATNAGTYAPDYVSAGGPSDLAYLDFGSEMSIWSGGRDLYLSRALNSVRAAYVVCRLAQGAGTPLGSHGISDVATEPNSGVICDFLRQYDQLVSSNPGAACAYNGTCFTNGVEVSPSTKPDTNAWMLVEWHTAGGSHFSGIGMDRGSGSNSGGFQVGEMVVYERVLTAREKLATRNHLLKKWFGKTDAELPDLPAAEPAESWSRLEVNGAYDFVVDSDQSADRLVGAGAFTKAGAGTLTLGDWSAFTGTVAVTEGTLAITKGTSSGAGARPTDGLIYWADAAQGVTATTNAAGTVQISRWDSAVGNGWSAVPIRTGYYPTYVNASELNDGWAVNMARDAYQALVFETNGVRTPLTGIRSVFWLLGSQETGGCMLGGGTNAHNAAQHYNFHRGIVSDATRSASDAILNGSHAVVEARQAAWRKNGESIAPSSTGLSGAWDLLSMVTREDAEYPIEAEGFAFDGRYLDNCSMNTRLGGQRLAEVLIYDRRLTDDEVAGVEAYLAAKWNFGVQGAVPAGVAVALDAGTTLDLGGKTNAVASVTGAGTVQNGALLPRRIVCDGARTPAEVPTATAALVVTADVEIDCVNVAALGEALYGREIPLFNAASVEGNLRAVRSANFTGDAFTPGVTPKLVFKDGVLYARFAPKGSALFLR